MAFLRYKTAYYLVLLPLISPPTTSSAFIFPTNPFISNLFDDGGGNNGDGNNPYHHLSGLFFLSSATTSNPASTADNNTPQQQQPPPSPPHAAVAPPLLSRLFNRKPPKPTQITSLTYPNNTILPKTTVERAVTRSQILGSTDFQKSVSEFSSLVKAWYKRNGYILHGVTGVTISPSGDCAIQLTEPKVATRAIRFVGVKEMVKEEDGSLISLGRYRQREKKLKRVAVPASRSSGGGGGARELNTTFVETATRTRGSEKWYRGMGLIPGEAFRWSEERWRRCMVRSGIFRRILRAEPVTLEDGTVQLQVIAEESPARSLEYGVASSLYTGAWEGEMDFQHGNLLGAGENIGITVSRGTKDPEPSIRIHYQDDQFGAAGGYQITLFNDYIGDDESSSSSLDKSQTSSKRHGDEPLLRRGATLEFPHLQYFKTSKAKMGLERVTTSKGHGEKILTGTFDVGPYVRHYNDDDDSGSRTSWKMTLDAGGRRSNDAAAGFAIDDEERLSFGGGGGGGVVSLPLFANLVATARHVFPFASSDTTSSLPSLALEHKAGAGVNLPRHLAKAVGVAARVRGYKVGSNGPLRSFLGGTAEVRLPVREDWFGLRRLSMMGEVSVCVFGDWLYADGVVGQRVGGSGVRGLKRGGGDGMREGKLGSDGEGGDERERGYILGSGGMFRKGSVGVGLRASIQGIPVKYDLCVTQEGKIGSFFGIGKDFDVY